MADGFLEFLLQKAPAFPDFVPGGRSVQLTEIGMADRMGPNGMAGVQPSVHLASIHQPGRGFPFGLVPVIGFSDPTGHQKLGGGNLVFFQET